MNGLKRNLAKLFQNDGTLFLMAMDHAQCGLTEGLEDIGGLLSRRARSHVDGFLLNAGLAPRMAEGELLQKKLALRTSFGGTKLGNMSNVHKNHVSPEMALRLGADAVVLMTVVGGNDYESLQDAAAAIDGYHRFGIPVIAEVLCADMAKTQTFEVQANGARAAAELGADVVKGFYTEHFDRVVQNCPVPFILAGGPKGADINEIAREAVGVGVKGFAFGRNLFQSAEPEQIIDLLSGILHGA